MNTNNGMMNGTAAAPGGMGMGATSTLGIGTTMYNFATGNDMADLTFNQLLGINTAGNIVGYYGSGADAARPNVGYMLMGTAFTTANYPMAVQTQQIGIDNKGDSVGFYIDTAGTTHGFWRTAATGAYQTVDNPNTGNGTVNQLLGINNNDYAVGFYNTADGVSHAYSYGFTTKSFNDILPTACNSTQATSTNDNGDVVGFCTIMNGQTVSFLAHGSMYTTFTVPGTNVSDVQALGINNNRLIVGSFVDTMGVTRGFTATANVAADMITVANFMQIDFPATGTKGTVLNGVNDKGTIVGFYTDAAGNTNGMVATAGGTGMIVALGAAATTNPGTGGTGGTGTGGGMMGGSTTTMSASMNSTQGGKSSAINSRGRPTLIGGIAILSLALSLIL